MLDQSRLQRQLGNIEAWKKQSRKGTLLAVTGYGKTFAAFLGIDDYRKEYPNGKIVIVVPTTFLQQQWGALIQERGLTNIQVWTIQSLTAGPNSPDSLDTALLILDEIHAYTGPVFHTVFLKVKYNHILGLTATFPEDDEKYAIIQEKAPVFDRVEMQECVLKGWVSPFLVYNVGLELSVEDREMYKKLSADFGKNFALFGHDLNLAIRCLGDKKAREIVAANLNMEEKRILIAAVNFRRNMETRKNFLYHHPKKFTTALDLVNSNPGKHIITFSQTVETAETLRSMLGDRAVSYHSRVEAMGKIPKTKMREWAIAQFTERKDGCHVLCTARALDLGADIPEIDMGITLSGSSKALQAIQRYGRTIRAREGKTTTIVELYMTNTQDEKWLRKRQEQTPPSAIKWVTDISQVGT